MAWGGRWITPNCQKHLPVRQRCRSLMDYLKVLKTDAYSFHIGLWGKFCFGEVGSIGDWVIDCCIAGVLLFFVCVFWLVELLIFRYLYFQIFLAIVFFLLSGLDVGMGMECSWSILGSGGWFPDRILVIESDSCNVLDHESLYRCISPWARNIRHASVLFYILALRLKL